jgi:hypothetical protein
MKGEASASPFIVFENPDAFALANTRSLAERSRAAEHS